MDLKNKTPCCEFLDSIYETEAQAFKALSEESYNTREGYSWEIQKRRLK